MRARTKKRAALDRQNEKVAKAFREVFPICMDCGRRFGDRIQVHEIANGAARKHARGDRRCLLALCRDCHAAVHAKRTIARELAIKLVKDPEYFCPETVMELMGYASTYITLAEIAEHLEVRP